MAPMTHDGFTRYAIKVGEVHIVALRGELDREAAVGLSTWLVEIAGSPVVVDLSELSFMDSSASQPSPQPNRVWKPTGTN
jgi:hypothetical protein